MELYFCIVSIDWIGDLLLLLEIFLRSKISQSFPSGADLPNALLIFLTPLPPTSIGYPNDNFPLVCPSIRGEHTYVQKIGDYLTKIAVREQDAAPLK